jgi:heterodisulfide reductase subunit D
MEEGLVETGGQPAPTEPQPEPKPAAPKEPQPEPVREIPVSNLPAGRLIQLEACTRCGECLNWCPVHDQDPREQVIPRKKVADFLRIVKNQQSLLTRIMKQGRVSDPIKKLLAAVFRYREIGQDEMDEFVRNLYECSTCGQCQVVCPANIDTVNLWEDIRRLIVTAGYGPLDSQKVLVKSVKAYDNPWQQPRAARTKWARRAQKDGQIAAPPREIKKNQAKVLLWLGCTAVYDVNVKQIAISTINILESLGIDYGCLGGDEKCCGSVLLRMGDAEFERIAGDNIRQLNSLGIQTLVSSCSGCFKTIKEDYPKVGKLNFEVLHTVEFLRRLLEDKKLPAFQPLEKKITYHDPCHLGRASGVFDDPRIILGAIPGLELIEMPRSREYSRCCGAGGGLKAGYPDIQNKMAQERVKEAQSTGAQELISACPFCYAGLQVGIKALDSPLVMKDLTALVEESLIQKAG